MGEKMTCPSEPAAVPSPSANERRSGPTTRAMAASARENDVNATPIPTSRPALRWSAIPLSEIAMPAIPVA